MRGKTGDVIWQAKGKCPNLLVFPPRFSEYIKYSRAVKSIYGRYTDMIEPFGIDECWLDVSGSTRLFGSPETIADDVREAVKKNSDLLFPWVCHLIKCLQSSVAI